MTYTKRHVEDRYSNVNYLNRDFNEGGLSAIEEHKKRFTIAKNANYTPYIVREEQRYTIIVEFYREYFGDEVIDVGTRNTILSDKLGHPCSLVDKNNPELPSFDWEKEKLPYEARSFDTVVCLDVLEHVDTFHDSFYDLLRISNEYVIISLPNNWKKTFNEFIRGRGRWPHYGIPPEKPLDRHKWFFNTEDIEDFIYYHSARSLGNYEIVDVQYHIPKTIPRIKLLYPIFRSILPEYQFKNLFVETVFFVLKKKN